VVQRRLSATVDVRIIAQVPIPASRIKINPLAEGSEAALAASVGVSSFAQL
jgi:hypothetical protein